VTKVFSDILFQNSLLLSLFGYASSSQLLQFKINYGVKGNFAKVLKIIAIFDGCLEYRKYQKVYLSEASCVSNVTIPISEVKVWSFVIYHLHIRMFENRRVCVLHFLHNVIIKFSNLSTIFHHTELQTVHSTAPLLLRSHNPTSHISSVEIFVDMISEERLTDHDFAESGMSHRTTALQRRSGRKSLQPSG